MDYELHDEDPELSVRIDACLATRDVEEARTLADIFFTIGDEEEGRRFHALAHQWEKEDDAHDQSINN